MAQHIPVSESLNASNALTALMLTRERSAETLRILPSADAGEDADAGADAAVSHRRMARAAAHASGNGWSSSVPRSSLAALQSLLGRARPAAACRARARASAVPRQP